MNKLLFRILCLLCLSTSFSVFAQEPNPTNPEPKPTKEQPLDKPTELKEAPPKQDPALADKKTDVAALVAGGIAVGKTPEASPENKIANFFQDIPVNLFLGTPIVGFPIYNLTEAGGASVPIALSYNATGMKGQDVASWCGINWVMNFAQINRIVRGLPDEGKFTLNNDYSATARKGFYQFGLKADNDIENDGQPDLFFLNINGMSYKFSFDANKTPHFYPEADIDVQVTWTARPSDDPNILSNVGYFSNWIVTMPDGTKYYFAGPSAYESSFEQEAQAAKDINNFNAGRYLNAEEVVSAFYLTKIETAFGHQTNFEYHTTAYSFSRVAEQEATTINCTFTDIEKKINRVFVISSTLFKISNGTHVVEFNKGGWSQGADLYGRPYWYLNTNYPARKDIDFFSQDTRDSSNARALHKISVYAKDDPTKLYEWKFKYDYSTGADQSTSPLGYSYSIIGRTHQQRFKLRSIEEPDGNKYTFKYFDDGFFLLPSRLTQGIDHWGYLNGVLGSNLMIGQDAFRNCANGQYADRTARVTWSQYGTLTGISHSTGGSTLLEYENNTASNYSSLIGGSRVKKISFVDSVSTLKTVKKYEYKQTNGQSSGFLCLKPVYHFDDKNNYQGAPNQFWNSGLYQQLLSESGRPAVGYSRVKETIFSGDETDSLGYMISEFLQPLQEINLTETFYTCYDVSGTTVCDTFKYVRPWKWQPLHDYTVGVPSRVAVYGKANQILSESKSVYSQDQLQRSPPLNYQQNYHSFRLVGKNYNFEGSYYEFYWTYRLTSDTTKIYSQDGINPMTSYNSYQYAAGARHNQVVKTLTTDSYGNTIENSMKYAIDFDFVKIVFGIPIGVTPANIEARGIRAVKQKHIFNVPIESIVKRKSYFGNTFVVNANYQSYYSADSVGVKAGMFKSNFVLENVPRPSFDELSYNPDTDTFIRSSDYDLKATVEAYTSIGLPKQTNTRFATQSKVNYDATYPTLPISQISNLGLVSEQTTSTEYAKILYGVSKQTGVNGLSVSNEYYADGKLKQQTDKDGKVLKHIQYVYRGQADADPLLTTNTGYNRIITRIPRIATTTPLTLTHTDCAISVTYMDGSGRVVEQIGYRASPNEKDMVSGVTEYDKFSRPIKAWLAVESTQTTGGLLDTAIVKSIARAFYKDTKPYTEVFEYEASPLSRIFKSYGAGKVWRDSLKYVQGRYETATGIRRFVLSYNDNIAYIGTYTTYELSKITSTDERGNKVIEYKDRSGNIIQRDVQVDDTNYLTVCYIFDDAGRLRYTLTPKAYNALSSLPASTTLDIETWSQFNENVYALHYDSRFRVYESHKPGIGWLKTVFNRLNQIVLSQDSDELAKNNTWNYFQTDGQGRSVKSGQANFPTGYDRQYLQEIFNNFTVSKQFEQRLPLGASGEVLGYDNNSFPNLLRSYVTPQSLKNVSYYDNYSWVYSDPYSGPASAYAFQSNPYNATAYSNTNATGLATGGLYKIDNFGDFLFPYTAYSDDKNRTIQTIAYQDLYARNQSDVQYNFVGESLQNRMIYRKSGASDNIITTEKILDHVGRTKDTYYNLVEGTIQKIPRFRMSSILYDNLGRIRTKFIQPADNLKASKSSGNWTTSTIWQNNTIPTSNSYVVISKGDTVTIPASTTVTAATLYDSGMLKFLGNAQLQMSALGVNIKPALQSIDYSYNVRSQMRGVNIDANGNPQTSTDKLFSYKIDYHEDGRYFDGSISKMTWKAQNSPQNRSYLYSYDRSNRLLNSQFSGVGTENYSVSNSYDANGNILTLQRYSKTGTNTFGLVDNLTYSYLNNGNKLQKIDDVISGNVPSNDFRDVTGNDYIFSVDGKLTKDNNKSIFNIKYNFLDLVSKITFNDSTKVEYFYTSTGERRQRKVTQNGVISYTLYDGEMVYQFTGVNTSLNDFKVSEIQNSEGRFVNGKLEYGYTDHVGNLRLSYKDSLGVAFITQSQSYDPWSNVNAGSEYQLADIQGDRYLVSGKENDSITGNTLLDWRDYDSVIGRMNSYDPEDQFVDISGFAYCMNNPVSHIDPSGRIVPLLVIGVGALVGGLGNLGVKAYQGRIGSWGDGFAAFGIGAVAGAAGAFTGGSAFLAAGGSFAVAGAGGFVAGAVGGVAGSAVSSPIQGFGNAAYFKDPYSAGDFGRDVALGGLFGGVGNGLAAGFNKKSFFNGNPLADGYGTFSFGNGKALAEQGWQKLSNGKWFRAGNGDAIYGPVEKQLADGSMSWSDDFAGHTTGDVYGGGSSQLQLSSGASTLPKHHVFPQALRSWFSSRNLQNIDDYTIQISKSLHKQLHSGGGRGGVWNSEWQQFKNQNPFATQQQIFKQAEDMMFKYQLEFSRFVKYK